MAWVTNAGRQVLSVGSTLVTYAAPLHAAKCPQFGYTFRCPEVHLVESIAVRNAVEATFASLSRGDMHSVGTIHTMFGLIHFASTKVGLTAPVTHHGPGGNAAH